MNKYNRRSRPNLRHVCEFWVPSDTATESGELVQDFTLYYKGPFSMETPLKPSEIAAEGRIQSEQQFVLIGQWCAPASKITAGMFCAIPSLQKVMSVKGPATDNWGDRKKLWVFVMDNVSQPITLQLMPSLI